MSAASEQCGTANREQATKGADQACRTALKEQRIAVVCSARSNHSKKEGTTNRCVLTQTRNFFLNFF